MQEYDFKVAIYLNFSKIANVLDIYIKFTIV